MAKIMVRSTKARLKDVKGPLTVDELKILKRFARGELIKESCRTIGMIAADATLGEVLDGRGVITSANIREALGV